MATIRELFNKARLVWSTESMHHMVGVVREDFLSGQVLKVRTGNLRSRIDSAVLNTQDGFQIGTHVDYGVAWETGFTRPAMTIVPRRAKALRFEVGGQVLFRKRVNLPSKSFAARPFLKPALDRELPYLQRTADEAFQVVLDNSFPNRVIVI
jgi:hypothetical protein